MRKKPPAIWEVLTGNRKVLFGVVSLLLALTLAFSAIYNRTSTYSSLGTIEPGETVGINKRRSGNEGKLKLTLEDEPARKSIKVTLLDDNQESVRSVSLNSQKETIAVEIGKKISYFKLVSGNKSYEYEYRIKFSYQPFRWFSIPAALFTVFGVVAVYRGFDEFIAEFAEERVQSSEEGEGEVRGEGRHVDFMGADNKENKDD